MKDNDESLFSVYDTMANLKLDQKEYKQALKWYDKALLEKNIPEESYINILCNKSVALFKLNEYPKSIKILHSINLNKIKNTNLINRIRTLIEYTKWLENKDYKAEERIRLILNDKLKNKDLWGANSSYSHLAEINQNTNIVSSLHYAKEMYNVALEIKSPEDRLEAIERIILVDEPSNSKEHFKEYKTLSDSIQASRNNYRNSFAFIKYDSEKKNTENQKLKAETTEKEIELLQRNIGIGTLSILLIGGFFWYQKRKKRLQQEKELEVKNTELKMSKKVHDVVANGIYQVMTKIENQEHFDKDKALDELDFVYNKSRNLSYEKNNNEEETPFEQRISELIGSFKNDSLNTYIVGNSKNIWNGLEASVKEEVYQIIRELLVNMKKHSQADRVVFKFDKNNHQIEIQYTDNGIGISGDIIRKNGLTNTGTRIETIHGKITFDTKIKKGLRINFSFPAP